MSKSLAKRTKIFRNGGCRAVRLPQDCSFPPGVKEVSARREGNRIILEPLDEWPDGFFEKLGMSDEEFVRPPDEDISTLRNPFEIGRPKVEAHRKTGKTSKKKIAKKRTKSLRKPD